MELLEVGDMIQRFEFDVPKGSGYKITSVTKTLAKTKDGHYIFFREINEKGEVNRKNDFFSFNKRYKVIRL